MDKFGQYIFKKKSPEIILIEFIGKTFFYECSYEEIKNEFLTRLTIKDLKEQNEKETAFINEKHDFSYEELENRISTFLTSKESVFTTFIKNLSIEGRVLKLEYYTLDETSSVVDEIVISDELLMDDKFSKILSLIVRTFENNKEDLVKQFYANKKNKENIELANKSIKTYFDNKNKFYNMLQKEAIVLDAVIHNQQEDSLNFFDNNYRVNHPLKVISCMGIPLITLLILIESFFKLSFNLFGITVSLVSMGGIIYIENKIWKKIVYNKFIDFKKELEEKYNISYDLEKKRVILNSQKDFYDSYTTCIKSTLELAYSKLTTPLEEEIRTLYLLLNEYQNSKNTPLEKTYFVAELLKIKEQILLKESDKKYSFKNDEIKFAKQCIMYLTGKNSDALDDRRINSCLEKIEQSEKRGMNAEAVNLIKGLVEYIYEKYLKEEKVEVSNRFLKELESNVEYDIDIALGKKINESN